MNVDFVEEEEEEEEEGEEEEETAAVASRIIAEEGEGQSHDGAETLHICLSMLSTADSLVLQVNEFHYDPESDGTSANWFGECKDIIRNDPADIPDGEKVGLLLGELVEMKDSSVSFMEE
ncbi:hypothetical protein ACTXT7_017394 [Hymenolepis weldensis]